MKKVDFLLNCEVKSRELEAYCLLKLERRGILLKLQIL